MIKTQGSAAHLVLACEPQHVGVEQKEEDKADGEEVHVETEQHSGLEEVPPLAAHATEGVGAADDGDAGGNDEEWVCAVVGESGEEIGYAEAYKYERVTSKERTVMRIENSGYHAVAEEKLQARIGHAWMDWLNG
ncbi:hypothetical protein GCM10011585_16560 [Edaphobacter dinghuensis]|uniref:Uncharacterized protein n=1 Tax=Edaphobacter dinghuensis TaxID=1560005 RepID=A0A917M306_9BACT|nr:hypothetical protein GCM10011585_16560 [Edaphobacter dinghuensis]